MTYPSSLPEAQRAVDRTNEAITEYLRSLPGQRAVTSEQLAEHARRIDDYLAAVAERDGARFAPA